MRKIIIHNPCNVHTRYFRMYNLFWDQLTDKLKEKYIVEENRYYEFANSKNFEVNLKKQISDKGDFSLLECEYVIEFDDSGEFYIMSASDDLTSAILNEKSNPNLKKVLISQFNRKKIIHHVGEENMVKYSPWIYFPCTIDDLEEFYEKRKLIKNKIDKMYFRGTSIKDRTLLTSINTKYLEGYEPIGGPKTYFEDLIKYKIGLSMSGRGELCYRDIEYMAIGIPFIRFQYDSELNPNLIPNFHYISVDKPNDLIYDRLGNANHAKMIENKFLEIKDDEDFLQYIADNARNYYLKYLNNNNVIHTINLLNL